MEIESRNARILVTGAAGKTGQAVVRALAARGTTVRAAVRRPEQVTSLLDTGAAEAVVGDLRSRDHLEQATRDVETLYHICPNLRPDEVSIAQLLLRACQMQGVRRFVYHSVLHPQSEDMPHHWQKLRVEELLFRSDLDVTVLQPAAYMQNLLPYWPAIVETGIFRVPYAATTRLGMVDLLDVAEAAARILTEDGHAGATYELAGGEIVTQLQIARIAGRILGQTVDVEVQPRAEWAATARASGLEAYAVATLQRMFHYYESYGFTGNPTVLTYLLGRAPGTLAHFFRRLLS